jgi:ribosomal protein S18 acetylase RimI-like enzyme
VPLVARSDVVRRGSERLRVGRWRAGSRVGYLAPVGEAPPPTATMIHHCCELLVGRGFDDVLTGALSPAEQRGFLDAGFEMRASLHLLVHDLQDLPPTPAAPLRRARPGDRSAVLAVDAAAFPPFWRLDGEGLADALGATPVSRFRVADDDGVRGYAIVGRAARRGYVQRLAVAPAAQGHGLGRSLLVDGLRWLRRRGVERAVVNTQVDNERARRLYESLGFRLAPSGLAVLGRSLQVPASVR